jgi:hypothetical protein
MIEKTGVHEYCLVCDNCGDVCDEVFDSFQEAVEYKKDKDNSWRVIKDKNNDWQDLCPACTTPEIIAELKGMDVPDKSRDESDAAALAYKALVENL